MALALAKPDFDLTQIINGDPVMAPSPFGYHQSILGKLYFLLNLYLEKNKQGEVLLSPLDVILEEGLNVVQPDLIYIKKENMSIFHKDGHIKGVPDLLIEIVSPGSVSRDTVEKFQIYEKYGVSEYWIVFPEQKVVEVFELKSGKYHLFCSTENTKGILSSKLLPEFQINIETLFV